MSNKLLLSAAIVVITKMGMMYQVSSMEKVPESNSEAKNDKSGLSDAEKKRLIENRLIIEQAMKQQLGEDLSRESKDIRDVISGNEYALSKQVKFKCPTSKMTKTGAHITGDMYTDDKKIVWLGKYISFNLAKVDVSRKNNTYITINCWYNTENKERWVLPVVRIDFEASGIDPNTISFDESKVTWETHFGVQIASSNENIEFTASRK